MKLINYWTEDKTQRFISFIKKVGIVLLLGLLYAMFVKKTGIGIPCMFYKLTGLYCPGCGVSRMCLALLQRDIEKAFHYNVAIMITLPYFVWIGIDSAVAYIRNGIVKHTRRREIVLWIVLVFFVVFGILRNIPKFSYLAP